MLIYNYIKYSTLYNSEKYKYPHFSAPEVGELLNGQ